MKYDDIIRMAREAGLAQWSEFAGADAFTFAMPEKLERFAELVAADRDALRHRVRELEEAMRLCGIDHVSLLRIATAIRGSSP